MKSLSATKIYALAFGLFLGLCIWKFGNPVILDQKISAPVSLSDFLNEPWPTHWANWIFLPLAAIGAILIFQEKISWLRMKWLWLLPLAWLGWQFVSATQTVDADLTAITLWQYAGCVACYFLGALIFARNNLWRWLLPGLLAAFTFCLVRGIDQRVFEFPQNRQMLVEGQRSGWTNFPPATVVEMKNENVIITTNGLDMANPVILDKLKKGRVYGTLVYPNALAGLILLLWPASLALALGGTKQMKPIIRLGAIAMTVFLGSAAFYWSGSKLGWLIGIGIAGIFLLRLDGPKKLKLAAVAMVFILGLGIFAVRFHNYFAAGATSVGARFDYWRAAMQTTVAKPVFGTGPGTFQRPYAQLKSPKAEMTRLAHNDYLEQFSDSGVVGGLTYVAWIFLALAVAGKRLWGSGDHLSFAVFAGLLGWFVQGFGEFSLFVPALAWTAFTLLGCLLSKISSEEVFALFRGKSKVQSP
ncbi:MAG TPA: O-antigen ligase family protein [Verrucomicrobiae bacterium]